MSALESQVKNNGHSGTYENFPQKIGRVYALGLTYLEHIKETGEKQEGRPAIFEKICDATVAPIEVAAPSSSSLLRRVRLLDPALAERLARRFPRFPVMLDYEIELGILLKESVTKKQLEMTSGLPRLGYFLANDLSARSVQICGESSRERMNFWSAAKSFEGFLPVANSVWYPEQSSRDHFPEVELELTVNGEIRQSDTTENLIYTPREMLRFALEASPNARLEEGDVILTGTPAGVALKVSKLKRFIGKVLPKPLVVNSVIRSGLDNRAFLSSGDTVSMSAGWIGSMSFLIE